jgi:hypothetical protein
MYVTKRLAIRISMRLPCTDHSAAYGFYYVGITIEIAGEWPRKIVLAPKRCRNIKSAAGKQRPPLLDSTTA